MDATPADSAPAPDAGVPASARSRTGAARPRPRPWELAVLAVALLVHLALVRGEALHQSATIDEFHLVPQAVTLRATGDLELGVKTPPLLKRWIGLALDPADYRLVDHRENGRPAMDGWEPWVFATRFMGANVERLDAMYARARAMAMPLSLLLGLVLWGWARALAGARGGAWAAGLFALSPELIAFGSLVSLDLAVTALLVGCVFYLRQHLARGGRWRLVVSAGLYGLSLSVKFAVLIVAPVLLLLALPVGVPRSLARRAADVALFAGVALLALHATFGFREPLPTVGELPAVSERFQALQRTLPAGLPLPAPRAWLQGVDLQGKDVQVSDIASYLDGEWSTAGWKRYYLVAWLYKTPLALIALTALAVAAGLRARGDPGPLPAWAEWSLLLGPLLLWGGVFSLTGKLNIGVRYVLPCYALLVVVVAALLARLRPRAPAGLAALVLFVAFAGTSLAAYPHHLAHFNLLAGGRTGGHRHLADSNVDWGQELKHLADYVEERDLGRIGLAYFGHVAPEVYGIDYFVPAGAPAPGWYAISVNFLVGYSYVVLDNGTVVPAPAERFAAFRELEPVDTIGGALNVYRVDP